MKDLQIGDNMKDLQKIIDMQKNYFQSFVTNSKTFRLKQLNTLKFIIKENEDKILEALKEDLNKDSLEAYMTELGLVYSEIDYHIKNLNKHMKKKYVKSPLMLFKSTSYYQYKPYGQVLIIGPFNYPIQLILIPLIGAIASGNTIIIKPSEQSIRCSLVLREILSKVFNPEYLYVIDPKLSVEELNTVLDYQYDMIFFTGSSRVAKIVAKKATQYLTPVVLELGGKSPCIIDEKVDLKMSAKRIVWGKLVNAGQTCIAPDYILVHESIKNSFIVELLNEFKKQYNSKQFARIINKAACKRIVELLGENKIIYGGSHDIDSCFIEPTVVDVDNLESKIMQEEIFGPLLPIVTYSDLGSQLKDLAKKDKPLALYFFSNNKKNIEKVINNSFSGGVVINDTLIHISNNRLPFGGVQNSGMGSYHGLHSIQAFSYKKSIVKRSIKFELPFRYMPYTKKHDKTLRKVIK